MNVTTPTKVKEKHRTKLQDNTNRNYDITTPKDFSQAKTMNGHWYLSLLFFHFFSESGQPKHLFRIQKTVNGEMLNINAKTSTLSWGTLLPTRTKKSKCASTSPMRIQLPLRILMVLTLAPLFCEENTSRGNN